MASETEISASPTSSNSTAREPASRSYLLGGSVDALYNSRIYAEQWRLRAEIGRRNIPIIGGMFSSVMGFGETYLARPLRMAVGLVIGAIRVDPETQLPEIPEGMGRDLQRDLPESFRNLVEVAAGKNDAAHGILSLSPTRYQQGNARAAHAEAIAEVRTMPEVQAERNRSVESRLAALENRGGPRESGHALLGALESPSLQNLARRFVSGVAA